MEDSGSDLSYRATHIDIPGRRWRLVVADIVPVTMAQAVTGAAAPAANCTACHHGTGVIATSGQIHGLAAKIDFTDRRRMFVISDDDSRTQSQLARSITAPAANRPGFFHQSARMRAAGDHLDSRTAKFDIPGRRRHFVIPMLSVLP